MSSKLYITLLGLLLVLFSCNSSKPQKRDREREQNKTYSKDAANDLKVDMFLFHADSINSQLYYSINNSQLIYKKTDSTNNFSARVKVFYKFLPYADAKVFFDSSTVYITDKVAGEPQAKTIAGYIPLKINVAQTSYIELDISDVNGKRHQTHFIKCEKQDPYAQQSYILMGNNKQVFFSNKIEKGNSINLYNTRVTFSKARVDFFANDYSLPPPPFSQREPLPYPSTPDSTFYISTNNGHSIPLQITRQGIYFIRLDTATSGCMIMGVEPHFPKVLSHEQMIAATRFIMNKDEYQKIASANDKEAAINNFWLTLGAGEDRAKELIKRYYNRVQDANTFFTSHIEGWKTDMGMIYIVFGPPNKTYKTKQMETWVYGNEGTPNSATFKFDKINNPFSENNFRLIRSQNYQYAWTVAVSNWRDGHVYLDAK
jgi:GWxTD domain-containing protein